MLEVRPITLDEADAFRECTLVTFGSDQPDDPTGGDRVRALIAPGRAWAAFDRGTIVATAGTFAHTLGVPGGALAMAGLTMVSVRPTHRRRGLLRELIRLHLEDARAHGEAFSGLWASEGTIYGRFGYGIAIESYALALDTRGALAAVGEPDACEWVELREARERLPAIYARAIADRPGALHRSDAWWRERRYLEGQRGGASLRRHVIARRGEQDVGYVQFRQRPGLAAGLPAGTTEIIELVAVDARAEATLWRLVAGIDLFPTAKWWNAPRDTVLPWIVEDPRRLERRVTETLWLRIDDVAATLAGRRYADDGALRFAANGATWELTVDAGAARCARVDAAPELDFAGTTLGSVFLGGVSVAALAQAGKLTGTSRAIARADRMFGWPVAAWIPEVF
jgi:predicted acetyltransferase